MKLNPVWLKTFQMLVETGHFTRTAETLFMTQPGVSQHIKKLEAACGHTLLKRKGKSFTITAQGEQLYNYVRQLREAEHQLLSQMGADDPFAGACRLACSGSTAIRLYGHLLDLQQQHPALTIHMEAAPYRSILQGITQGHIDLGIVSEKPDSLHFSAQPIGREAIALMVPAHRPQGARSLSSYLSELGMIRHPDSDYYTSLYLGSSASATLRAVPFAQIPTHGFINQIHDILLPVARGLGFTVLPRSVLEKGNYGERVSVMGNIPLIEEPLFLIYRQNRELPARFNTLIPLLKDQLQ